MTTEPEVTPLPLVAAAAEDLRHAHRDLLRVVDALSAEDWERPVPYGEWPVKDLIAHCIGDMSPSGPGLILAGVLTPEFIAETSKYVDVRTRNSSLVDERRRYTREDLRQLLFEAHDAMIGAMLRLDESHVPVLNYAVPMGPGYDLRVEDWLWHGYHDRQHADDIRRALEVNYTPARLSYLPEVEDKFRLLFRYREGLLRAIYSVDPGAWDEPGPSAGWTYRDLLAHIISNDIRPATRLRHIAGERDDTAMAALVRTDEWNQQQVEARRGRSVRELLDEAAANRHQLMLALSRLRPEHLSAEVALSGNRRLTVLQYIDGIGRHDSEHGGDLAPASRARRVAA
jgi:hypothetical protein